MNTVRKIVGLLLLVLLVPAFAQDINYTAIEPTLNADNGPCIDYPPLDDGIGWNGECRCLMEPEWAGFGSIVEATDNTLAIGAVLTPEMCPGYDDVYSPFSVPSSLSIYEKSASGSWIKTKEFRPFEGSGFRYLSFMDEKLVVGSSSTGERKVYENRNGEWQFVSVFEDEVAGTFARPYVYPGARQGFTNYINGLQGVIFGEVDSNGNETVTNELQIEGPGWQISNPLIFGDVAIADTDDELFIFTKSSSGNWQLGNRIPFRLPQSIVFFQDSVIVLDLRDNLHRWIRDNNGGWVKSEVFVTNLPYPVSYLETVPFQSNDTLMLTALGHFRTYMVNSENKLVESDRFELPLSGTQWRGIWGGGDHVRTIRERVDFGGGHLLTGNPSSNIAYVFDVSASGVFGESSDVASPNTGCDYSSADLYDGWGWNAASGTSCPPVSNNIMNSTDVNCDYSQADQYGGWGWNATTGTSCSPVVSHSTSPENNTGSDGHCDYSQADQHGGWGWDATTSQSCAPVNNIVDSQPAMQCIDTDGDGWGWDGMSSCQVSAECIDVDGDGWGWDSITSTSCRI